MDVDRGGGRRREWECPTSQGATPPLVAETRADGSRDGPSRGVRTILLHGARRRLGPGGGGPREALHGDAPDDAAPPPPPGARHAVLYALAGGLVRAGAQWEAACGTAGAATAWAGRAALWLRL